jgi:hypothetical protein
MTANQALVFDVQATEIGGIRYIPTGNVRVERGATRKHCTQTCRVGYIPMGDIRIESMAIKKHAIQIGIRNILTGNIRVES